MNDDQLLSILENMRAMLESTNRSLIAIRVALTNHQAQLDALADIAEHTLSAIALLSGVEPATTGGEYSDHDQASPGR